MCMKAPILACYLGKTPCCPCIRNIDFARIFNKSVRYDLETEHPRSLIASEIRPYADDWI